MSLEEKGILRIRRSNKDESGEGTKHRCIGEE
jgi:hypothetical protein